MASTFLSGARIKRVRARFDFVDSFVEILIRDDFRIATPYLSNAAALLSERPCETGNAPYRKRWSILRAAVLAKLCANCTIATHSTIAATITSS